MYENERNSHSRVSPPSSAPTLPAGGDPNAGSPGSRVHAHFVVGLTDESTARALQNSSSASLTQRKLQTTSVGSLTTQRKSHKNISRGNPGPKLVVVVVGPGDRPARAGGSPRPHHTPLIRTHDGMSSCAESESNWGHWRRSGSPHGSEQG